MCGFSHFSVIYIVYRACWIFKQIPININTMNMQIVNPRLCARFKKYFLIRCFLATMVFQIGTAYSDKIYKCCPDGSQLTELTEANEVSRTFACVSYLLANISDSVIGVNLRKSDDIQIPQCTDMDVSKFEDGKGLVGDGGCVDSLNGVMYQLGCLRNIKMEVQHVFKCCPAYQSYDINERLCVPNDYNFQFLKDVFHNSMSVLTTRTPRCSGDEAFVEYHVNSRKLILSRSGLRVRLRIIDEEEYLPPESFCIDETYDDRLKRPSDEFNLIVRGCSPISVCRRIPCVRRCCKNDQVMEIQNGTSVCVNHVKNVKPTFYDVEEPLDVNKSQSMVAVPEYGHLELQTCRKSPLNDDPDDPDDIHYISHTDGKLHVGSLGVLETNEYCIEHFNGGEIEMMTFVCLKPISQEQFKYYAIGLTISCAFLTVTLIVYGCLPKLLNLHGKTVVCYVTCLLAAYISLAIVQFHTESALSFCFVIALLLYFFFLAAFCWQSVMCFDIWWTFGSIRISRGMRKNKELRRFMLYSLYAWGVPSLLTLNLFLIDYFAILPREWNPQLGEGACWFGIKNWRAHFLFFIFPIGLHILTNAVLFILTAIYCNKVKGEIHRMQTASDTDAQKIKRRFLSNKTKYAMNMKLFIVMGVSWMLEIVAALLPQFNFIWYFTDTFNVLQGVLVFVIFVFKNKVWMSLQQKFGKGPQSIRGTTLATATSFMTGSRENLNAIKSAKMGKSTSYSTLPSSSINMRKVT